MMVVAKPCRHVHVPVCTIAMLLAVLCPDPTFGLDNGLALTPPMGLSTWSAFRKNVNDTLIRQLADAMVSSGLAKAGYNYLLIDDGWEGQGCQGCAPNRDASGRLVVDPAKFPQGLEPTAAYVHSKGLKFGLWFGHSMCATSNDTTTQSMSTHAEAGPGRADGTTAAEVADYAHYAALDAAFFASVGVDAIKHDNCVDVANTTSDVAANYQRYCMSGCTVATHRSNSFTTPCVPHAYATECVCGAGETLGSCAQRA